MVLHFLQSVDSGKQNRLLDILKKKTKDTNEINEAIDLLKDNGSLHYAKNKMHELVKNSLSEIE